MVPKHMRNESSVEFLDIARKLEKETIEMCVRFPKRYTFYVSQPLANTATRIHFLVKAGNSVYPQTAEDVATRRSYFVKAYAELQGMVSKVELAKELFPVAEKRLVILMGYIDKEAQLIKGILKSDRKRYKNLLEVKL